MCYGPSLIGKKFLELAEFFFSFFFFQRSKFTKLVRVSCVLTFFFRIFATPLPSKPYEFLKFFSSTESKRAIPSGQYGCCPFSLPIRTQETVYLTHRRCQLYNKAYLLTFCDSRASLSLCFRSAAAFMSSSQLSFSSSHLSSISSAA